ncbi:MAG TPA: hypothetical protein VFX19_11940, partial [Dehalococcoidia bacterium]|nr:hypothetical protein [Dehalococcoidia bacterium]
MLESIRALRRRWPAPDGSAAMSMPVTDLLLPLILTSALDILEWIVTLPVEIFHAYSSLLRWAADSVQTLFDKYG